VSAGEDLLKAGYKAYGDYVGWKSHTGKPMPSWDQLPPDTQGAWAAFARVVMAGLEGAAA
jgi:hypothetical protein